MLVLFHLVLIVLVMIVVVPVFAVAWILLLPIKETYTMFLICRKEWYSQTFRIIAGMILLGLLGAAYMVMFSAFSLEEKSIVMFLGAMGFGFILMPFIPYKSSKRGG